MSVSAVAQRYARAIHELGTETGRLSQLADEIQRIASIYAASPDLRAVLDNPLVEEQQREAILMVVGGKLDLSELAMNAIRLLAQRRRLVALPELARALGRLHDESSGVLRATVTSAQPLTEADEQKLKRSLERRTKRKVVLEKLHDPSLVAGVVTRIGDHTIDGSLKGRLEALERRLLTS